MSMTFINISIMFVDAFVGFVLFRMLELEHSKQLRFGFKFGVVVLMVGLLGQAFKNGYVLTTGTPFPLDEIFPLWFLKDMGAGICAISFVYYSIKYESFLKG